MLAETIQTSFPALTATELSSQAFNYMPVALAVGLGIFLTLLGVGLIRRIMSRAGGR